ncbi:MAG: hypothetical protein MRECE_20c008 [Mycoplasmataceae bacterium CE_OT135]|nr:MAG: hypothetical protein MRECE_20c008 [Mycoplasmataceae bacterium CE_OT135]
MNNYFSSLLGFRCQGKKIWFSLRKEKKKLFRQVSIFLLVMILIHFLVKLISLSLSLSLFIKEVGKFSGDNIYAIIPAEPINLEAERMVIIDAITIPYDGELCVGDTITIQDIDLNDLLNIRNRISENNGFRSWDIRGSFGGIVINEQVFSIENLGQAIRQNNENPQQPFFIFQGTDYKTAKLVEYEHIAILNTFNPVGK